ncbi:hypothetical protein KG112_01120 [Nocardioides sp. zg-ZUI104]|uniref:hypothetical protein n=1 Tax=Nocardioides faecalis TaxID=2803858 RepID=UPI001BCE3F42|nr:hypothetical protein [Nocardioides faecalis]MBS4751404.1 hypothetical protein [Nocardioides faecalis]
MRFRKLAGLSAGALTLGMLAAPALMAPANAAVTSTATAAFTCGTGVQTSAYNATITFKLAHNNGGASLSAKLTDMPNGAPAQFVNFPGATISNKLTVAANGADVVLEGSHKADFIGGTPTKMPEAKGSLATRPSSITVKSYSYDVKKADGTNAAAQSCTLAAPVEVTFADEAQLAGVNATCTIDMSASGFGGAGAYPAKLETTATMPAKGTVGTAMTVPVTAKITLGREFSDYLETSPVKKVTGKVAPKITVGAASATGDIALSTWNRTIPSGTGIGSPVNEFVSVEGAGNVTVKPAAAGIHNATLSGAAGTATMTVTFGDVTMDAPMDCVLAAPATVGAVSVAAAGPSAACKAATTNATKAASAYTAAKKAYTKAVKKVKALNKKVKKAKGAKKTKLKKQVKKAKKAQTSAKKKVSSTTKALSSANAAKKKSC